MTYLPSAQWPTYEGSLGFSLNAKSTTFTLWAPTATSVTLRLFETGNNSEPIQSYELKPHHDGAWRVNIRKRLDGTYYDYLVAFQDGTVNRTSDPWGIASGINGERSLVIDEDRVAPANWHKDKSPKFSAHSTVIWETHVSDYSSDVDGGFNPDHRGRFLAFTDEHTCVTSEVDGKTLTSPTGLDYLKKLGITHVQLMPIYDFCTVNEINLDKARKNGENVDSLYNWGYDPDAYNVPEGAYSTDPYDGTVRIRECKAMISSLHAHGLRVVMDVVYNHMYHADNAFERTAPGYFCRRNEESILSNGSGCGNDMASERPMFRRFIIESLLHWARCYHIDGFRFDLMGLIDTETLNQARQALDKLPDGKNILMYGEPWSAGFTAVSEGTSMGDKLGRHNLDDRIGWFSDETRDTLKGNVMDHHEHGYINGNEFWTSDSARQALDGWRGTPSAGKKVGQIIQYISAHDDLTLWDKLCISLREKPSDCDFYAKDANSVADLFTANMLAAGMVLCSAGLPFMLSGEEFGRTKGGNDNTYKSGVNVNKLDWVRSQKFEPLVRWYKDLISLRSKHKSFYDSKRVQIPASNKTVLASLIGDDVIVCVNPMYNSDACVTLPELSGNVDFKASGKASGKASCKESCNDWSIVLDSSFYFADWTGKDAKCANIESCERKDSHSVNDSRLEDLDSKNLNTGSHVLHIPSRTFVVLSKSGNAAQTPKK